MNWNYTITILKIVIWISCLYASTLISMEKIFFIVSCLYFMFTNLGKRKQGQLSAYSVFNKGFKKIQGTFDADEFLYGRKRGVSEESNKIMDDDQLEKAKLLDEYLGNPSKYGNKQCVCESGLKFKKCCLLKQKNKPKQMKKIE